LAYRAEFLSEARPTLKIGSLNLWVGNQDVETVARFLEAEAADVIILQEADRLHRALMDRVKGTYPHAYCPDRACSVALISRIAWIEVGKEDVPPRRPLLVWARFAQGPRTFRVIGIHLPYPFEARRQAEHTDWLIAYLRRRSEPTIIAGDFNLTPFTWKLLKLLHEVGLKLHILTGFTWPAHRYVPVVLLDNVLSTPELGTVSARVGPRIGSDHRPIVVDLAWR
jgi:endonuclease/exonuclease/phosphatase (EEP) superfamily protein YafD